MNKNAELLTNFADFCLRNPELRFWQALAAWSEATVYASDRDTFYWETRDGEPRKDASQTTYGLLAGRDLSK